MGNRHKSHETEDWELDAISNLVNIPRIQVENIYKNFQRISKDYLINKNEFRRMYKDLTGYSTYQDTYKRSFSQSNRQNNKTADRIFKIFSNDYPGRLTFDEFIAIYIMLQDSIDPRVRLNFLLDHYSQINGYITSDMTRRVIQDISNLYCINTDYEQVRRKIDANNDSNHGYIPKQAFIDYFMTHPAYSSAFYRGVKMLVSSPGSSQVK
jgi:Ca2+-binding EF-hand superfamily protein